MQSQPDAGPPVEGDCFLTYLRFGLPQICDFFLIKKKSNAIFLKQKQPLLLCEKVAAAEGNQGFKA
jgi:hypothetical protein